MFQKLSTALSTFILSMTFSLAAWANDADWIKPGTDLVERLESGGVQLGAGVIGVGIIAYGLVTSLSGEINWRRLGGMVFGGVCVFFGPEILVALLEWKNT